MYTASANFSLDNSALDARSFSVTGATVDKPAYANGRGGVMFGGPLRIPGLVSASKRIMFSLNYEFQRNRTGTTSNPANMPTALERTGDFSQTLVQGKSVTIYDPTTGLPFTGNVIPKTRLSRTALSLLQYFPSPNLTSASQNYQTSMNGLNKSQNLNGRLSNIRIGAKDRLNGGVGSQTSSSVTPNMFQFTDTGSGSGVNANLAWSHSFTSKLTNSLQYNFSHMRQESIPHFANGTDVAAELGISGTSRAAVDYGPPSLNFTNYGGLSDGNDSLSRNQTSSASDSLTWVHGAHNFSYGADYRRQQFNNFSDNNGRGAYTFNGFATSHIVNGVAESGTGYDLADFLLGMPTTASIRYGNPDSYFRGSSYDAFVNDDWRIASRFSVVLGLRWEFSTPVTELYNRLVNLVASPGYSAVTAVLAGQTPGRTACRTRSSIRTTTISRRGWASPGGPSPKVRSWCAAGTASTTTLPSTTSSP